LRAFDWIYYRLICNTMGSKHSKSKGRVSKAQNSPKQAEGGAQKAASAPAAAAATAPAPAPAPAPVQKPIEVDSEEYWWNEAEKLAEPINSAEEFCARFKGATEKDYKESVQVFKGMTTADPWNDFLTRETWLANAPKSAVKVFTKIWECFDVDGDGRFTLEEWLVFDGIRHHGSVEQRVIGSFLMNDKNHDHKLSREEVETLATDAGEVIGFKYPPDILKTFLDTTMAKGDADGDGFLELSEIIQLVRSDPNFAKVFGNCM